MSRIVSKRWSRITSPEGDRVIATPEARATYERDRAELLKGVSTVDSGSEYTPSMEVVRQVYALHPRINMLGAHRDEVAAEYDRAIDAHDAEVILEYVKRAKPEPIHIDNIDGVKASDWFRAHDAATREAVLVEVAGWLGGWRSAEMRSRLDPRSSRQTLKARVFLTTRLPQPTTLLPIRFAPLARRKT